MLTLQQTDWLKSRGRWLVKEWSALIGWYEKQQPFSKLPQIKKYPEKIRLLIAVGVIQRYPSATGGVLVWTGGVLVWNPSMGLDGISSIHKGITSAVLPRGV